MVGAARPEGRGAARAHNAGCRRRSWRRKVDGMVCLWKGKWPVRVLEARVSGRRAGGVDVRSVAVLPSPAPIKQGSSVKAQLC